MTTTEFVRALRPFKWGLHQVLTDDILRTDQLTTNLRSMLEAGFVKGVDPMGEKYDPHAMARLAKDVDKGITEGDPANPRNRANLTADAATGVPNPNVTIYTPETPLAAENERELAGEDLDAVAAETANTTEGLDAIAAETGSADDAEADTYDDMTVAQLREVARERGIASNGKTKAELVEALRK